MRLIIKKIIKLLNHYFEICERFYFKVNESNDFVKTTNFKKFIINIIKFIKYNEVIVKSHIYIIIVLIMFIINIEDINSDEFFILK